MAPASFSAAETPQRGPGRLTSRRRAQTWCFLFVAPCASEGTLPCFVAPAALLEDRFERSIVSLLWRCNEEFYHASTSIDQRLRWRGRLWVNILSVPSMAERSQEGSSKWRPMSDLKTGLAMLRKGGHNGQMSCLALQESPTSTSYTACTIV